MIGCVMQLSLGEYSMFQAVEIVQILSARPIAVCNATIPIPILSF